MVGTWKGKPVAPTGSKDLGSALAGMATALAGDFTLEFNEDGRYKISVSLGSGTGDYSVSGNEVTLTPDKDQKGQKMTFIIDGKTLREKKEFKSDMGLVFTRESSESPK